MPLKIGDVVTLKSGSPRMTVIATNKDDTKGLCQWFDQRYDDIGNIEFGQPRSEWWHENALRFDPGSRSALTPFSPEPPQSHYDPLRRKHDLDDDIPF